MKLTKRTAQTWPRDYLSSLFDEALRPFAFENENEAETTLWSPAVDIEEKKDKYVVKADLPGVEKEDIQLSLEDDVLTIKGERRYESKEEKEGFSRVERVHGQFYRRFTLPETTDESKIKASYKKGVLEILIPKKKEKTAKKIDVKVED